MRQPSVATAPNFPVLHVHVSGSAGTTFCELARKQHSTTGKVAGSAFACMLPSRGNLNWRDDSLRLGPLDKRTALMYTSCEHLAGSMTRHGYHVIGMAETFLYESNHTAMATNFSDLAPYRRLRLRGECGHCDNPKNARCCCRCNGPNLHQHAWRHDVGTEVRMLSVAPGEPSPFDAAYALDGWQPAATYCSNVRYSLLMNHPTRRIVTMLMSKCLQRPVWAQLNSSATTDASEQCAQRLAAFVYSQDLVLDPTDPTYLMGTLALSEYNIRMLLGPRVFFARLGGVRHKGYNYYKLGYTSCRI